MKDASELKTSVDRDRLADIIYLVRDLEGFEGVYETSGVPSVVVSNDRGRARAAARVTVLPGIDVNFVTTCRIGVRVQVSHAEIEAAARRDAKRREEWAKQRVERIAELQSRTPSVLIVSAWAPSFAEKLQALAPTPIDTYVLENARRVLDVLGTNPLPHVIVFDVSLGGVFDACRSVHDVYPDRFRALEAIQWIVGREGLTESDSTEILAALGAQAVVPSSPKRTLADARVLVIDTSHTLAREVALAAPGAHVEAADGWTALEKLDAGGFDLVVAGDANAVRLASLVRFVARSKPTPAIVIAREEPESTRMRTKFPHIAHYFFDRPITTSARVTNIS